jgi:hypothetical protein
LDKELKMSLRDEAKAKLKPNRVPLGRRNILTVKGLKDTDEYHYHFFNDVGDRLYNCLEAGYEFVDKAGLAVGDKTVEYARGTDSIVSKGVGRGIKAYLMRIPMELYKQDQQAKQLELDAVEEQIRNPSKDNGRYGSVKSESKITSGS